MNHPGRRGLVTTAWALTDEDLAFTWPIWEFAATSDTIRSLLQLRELVEPDTYRSLLRARGIATIFRSRRIKVGAGALHASDISPTAVRNLQRRYIHWYLRVAMTLARRVRYSP